MDFIERWFGLSPDGGNGTIELLSIAAVSLGVFLVVAKRRWSAFHRR
jgi:uncharacterized membrane protein YdjX (TVP38/TMEM64 family)